MARLWPGFFCLALAQLLAMAVVVGFGSAVHSPLTPALSRGRGSRSRAASKSRTTRYFISTYPSHPPRSVPSHPGEGADFGWFRNRVRLGISYRRIPRIHRVQSPLIREREPISVGFEIAYDSVFHIGVSLASTAVSPLSSGRGSRSRAASKSRTTRYFTSAYPSHPPRSVPSPSGEREPISVGFEIAYDSVFHIDVFLASTAVSPLSSGRGSRSRAASKSRTTRYFISAYPSHPPRSVPSHPGEGADFGWFRNRVRLGISYRRIPRIHRGQSPLIREREPISVGFEIAYDSVFHIGVSLASTAVSPLSSGRGSRFRLVSKSRTTRYFISAYPSHPPRSVPSPSGRGLG
ncbi:hypothetical protein SAMN05216496_2820 [Pseudomonas sp. Z003-0.4C(8344-21)]|nr:hypothetical protein SAMN05216496_2820 [Pseudomonas sp. Z003-0.4C(8344-21)]